MVDDIEALFAQAALLQAIVHADKEPPEAAFDNLDDLLAWLNDEQKDGGAAVKDAGKPHG